MMRGTLGLYRRGIIFWWRRRIPKRLESFFPTSGIRVSTRTHLSAVAANRAARLRVVTDALFEEVERLMFQGLSLTPGAMQAIAADIMRDALEVAERERALRPAREPAEADAAAAAERAKAEILRECLRLGRLEHVRQPLVAALARAGLPVDINSDDGKALHRWAARGLIQAAAINEKRENGIYEEDASAFVPVPTIPTPIVGVPAAVFPIARAIPAVGPVSPEPVAEETPPRTSRWPLFSEAAAALAAEAATRLKSWTDKGDMVRKHDASVRLFLEAFGDRSVDTYTRGEVRQFLSLVRRLPNNHGKSSRDRRTILEIVEDLDNAEKDKIEQLEQLRDEGRIDRKEFALQRDKVRIPRLSPTTIGLHIQRIHAVFDFAAEEIMKTERINPAKGVKLSRTEIEEIKASIPPTERLAWGPENLRRLFSTTAFSGSLADRTDSLFWAPILSVFHGFREEETLQLYTSDIERVDGVPCIRIRRGPGKKLKTGSSVRDVPIHKHVIELGFLEFVERRKAEGSQWLFTDIDRGMSSDSLSEIFSKRFSHYRFRQGVYDPQRDFHSLRKDFNVELKGKGVPWSSRKRLLGHVIEDMTDGPYDPTGDSMRVLKEYVDRLDFGLRVRRSGTEVSIYFEPSADALPQAEAA